MSYLNLILLLFKIAVSEDEGDGLSNQLATKTVALEPMLFNINMILVLEQILNDESVLLSFDARLMTTLVR